MDEQAGDSSETNSDPIIALYARVSTDRQERESTVHSQLEELRTAARERHPGAPSRDYLDEGYSRNDLVRPALDRMRDEAARGLIGTVLVQAPDCLASGARFMVAYEDLRSKGVNVAFLKAAVEDSPEGNMMLGMSSVFAEYERAKTSERTRRGKLHWARQGHMVSGSMPYGYRIVKRADVTRASIQVNEHEADVVREMYRLLVEDAMSTRAIAATLNERGIPTARGASQWKPTTVLRILRNPVHTGRFIYQRTRMVEPMTRRKDSRYNRRKTGRRVRPVEDQIHIPVPALVDEVTWAAAQRQLKLNSVNAKRNTTRHKYLLKGLVACPRCGGTYTGAAARGRRRYRCAHQDPVVSGRKCPPGSISADLLEEAVWNPVVSSLRRPDLLLSQYERTLEQENVTDATELEQARLEKGLRDVKKRKDRLTEAYLDEVIELDLFDARMKLLRAEAKETERRLELVTAEMSRTRHQREALDGLNEFSTAVAEGIDSLEFAGRRRILELLVEKVEITENMRSVTVHLVIPPQVPMGAAVVGGGLQYHHLEPVEGCATESRCCLG